MPEAHRLSRRAVVRGGLAAAATPLPCMRAAFAAQIPNILVEPTESLINHMSVALLEKAGGPLVGEVAGPLVSSTILGLLGLTQNDANNYDAYFTAIENKLDDIQAQIDKVQAQLGQLQESLDSLINDVASLSEKVAKLSVQQAISVFTQNANIVAQNFGSYRDALAALKSSESGQRKAASRQLFDLFDTINAQNISIALRNIQDAFLPRFSQQDGLLVYQSEMITAAVTHFASDPENLKMPDFTHGTPASLRARLPDYEIREVPNDDGVFAYGEILYGSHRKAQELLDTAVANMLRAFITVQLQGMLLLSSAWLRTINAHELQSHLDRNKKIFAEFAKVPAAVANNIDNVVAANLKRFGKSLGSPTNEKLWAVLGNFDHPYDPKGRAGHVDYYTQTNYPFSKEYIMWGRGKADEGQGPHDVLLLIERPWEYDNCRTVGVSWNVEPPKLDDIHAQFLPRTNLPRFDRAAASRSLAFVGHLV
jgi:hypothetical protein